MEDGIAYEDDRDPIPDYKFLESIMDVCQNPQKVYELSDERLILFIHLMSIGLYYSKLGCVSFKLDGNLQDFILHECNDCSEQLPKVRDIISQVDSQNTQLYDNVMNILNFAVNQFQYSDCVDNNSIDVRYLNFLEQLFSFLDDPLQLDNFSEAQFIVLVNLLVHGSYLNENYSVGFYLDEELNNVLKYYTATAEENEHIAHILKHLVSTQKLATYESFSALINYILYNFLKNQF